MSKLRTEIAAMIATVEKKKKLLDDLLDSLQSTLSKLDELPPELSEMIVEPLRRQTRAAMDAEDQHDDDDDLARFIESSQKEDTQFSRICSAFVDNGNALITVEKMAELIGASKSAVANILYRTQRGAFISQKISPRSRLRAWSLHPDLYQELRASQGE